jgi:signal transduction histidine kinase
VSAIGVAGLVRNYLWQRGVRESEAVGKNVTRFLENRSQRLERISPNRDRPQFRNMNRTLRRFNRGPSQLLLIKEGAIVLGAEDEEIDWSGLIPLLENGAHKVDFQDAAWQVVSQPVQGDLADRYAIIRPWSPSERLIRALVLYQIVVLLVVLGMALVAVTYFSSRLARPLEELRKKTEAIGRDRLEGLAPSLVTEIAELQGSFVEMSHRVEEAMASQRRFVADASHELKTPLTAISGMLELLKSHPDMETKDRARALSVAGKEAGRMESLIADLLLLSRAQANRSGAKEKVQLAEHVKEQIETLQVLYPEQKFELRGDTQVVFSINPGSFSRIIRNLMENACRYAPGEAIVVEFQESDSHIRVSVKDSGPGIPGEKVSQLFERFYRTDSGRARSEGGHGLGLAIVKALVEEAGGSIACFSEGQGAEFRILFYESRTSSST